MNLTVRFIFMYRYANPPPKKLVLNKCKKIILATKKSFAHHFVYNIYPCLCSICLCVTPMKLRQIKVSPKLIIIFLCQTEQYHPQNEFPKTKIGTNWKKKSLAKGAKKFTKKNRKK